MDAAFAWLFDHSTFVFGGAIVLFALLIFRLGKPNRWWKWLADGALVLAIAIAAAAIYFFTTLTGALDHRLETLAFTEYGSTKTHRLADYRGKVVFVNYWATWCPPCRAEMPDINKVVDAYRGKDVVFLALTDETPEVVGRYTAKYPIRASVARFTSDKPSGAIAAMSYAGRPTTMIIDREGRVRHRLIGARSFEEFDRAIRSAL